VKAPSLLERVLVVQQPDDLQPGRAHLGGEQFRVRRAQIDRTEPFDGLVEPVQGLGAEVGVAHPVAQVAGVRGDGLDQGRGGDAAGGGEGLSAVRGVLLGCAWLTTERDTL